MKKLVALIAAAVIVVLALVPAWASCGREMLTEDELPVMFEGRLLGSDQRGHRWLVQRSIRGPNVGDVITMSMFVQRRMGGFGQTTSIDLGPAPEVGGNYRVGAVVGRDGRMTASACGGFLQRAFAANEFRSPPDPWIGHAVIGASVPLMVAIVALLLAARSGRPRFADD